MKTIGEATSRSRRWRSGQASRWRSIRHQAFHLQRPFRIGQELIIGVLPFGASPGLAKFQRMEQRGGCRASTRGSARFHRHHGIETCWTGHGRRSSGFAVATLADVEQQLGDLGEIVRIGEERITLLRQFAIELF